MNIFGKDLKEKINNMAKKKFIITPAHEKFCQHYSQYGNATQAYIHAFPGSTYGSSRELGSNLLTNVDIKEKIEQLKEATALVAKQTAEQTVNELLVAAEEAKAQMQWGAYAKLREMVIKLCGLNPIEKQEITLKQEQPLFGKDKTGE